MFEKKQFKLLETIQMVENTIQMVEIQLVGMLLFQNTSNENRSSINFFSGEN